MYLFNPVHGSKNKLLMMTHMRSNDVFIGLPHDVFVFTMLQEIMARTLSVRLGTYKHSVGSLHLYDKNLNRAQQFLDEGYQPTNLPMPKMPEGDPWPALKILRKAECLLRHGLQPKEDLVNQLNPYWADLLRLLQVYSYSKTGYISGIESARRLMTSRIYDTFIKAKLSSSVSRKQNL